jgi:dihydrofolate synthase/folylpolyglutamate synthase
MALTYPETIRELFGLHQFSIKMGLDNIRALTELAGNPQNKYATLHIAGTNGKGSTAAILQQIITEHTLRAGLYTSPHLVDFRERIRIGQELIEADYVTRFWERRKEEIYRRKATFFDTATLLGFEYFADQQVDVAVIETGLGGRLDSTNILQPAAVVITPVDVDHIKQLGTDLAGITREKAAIIKPGCHAFYARQQDVVKNTLDEFAHIAAGNQHLEQVIQIDSVDIFEDRSYFSFTDRLRGESFHDVMLNLRGAFQVENALLAYLVSRWYLDSAGVGFCANRFRQALKYVQWHGRLQKVSDQPAIYFDVSHNSHGIRHTLPFIAQNFPKERSHLLIGLVDDKDYREIARLIAPVFASITVTEPEHDRPLAADILTSELQKHHTNAKSIKDLHEAYESCKKALPANHALYVMGSHFLVGKLLENEPQKDLT